MAIRVQVYIIFALGNCLLISTRPSVSLQIGSTLDTDNTDPPATTTTTTTSSPQTGSASDTDNTDPPATTTTTTTSSPQTGSASNTDNTDPPATTTTTTTSSPQTGSASDTDNTDPPATTTTTTTSSPQTGSASDTDNTDPPATTTTTTTSSPQTGSASDTDNTDPPATTTTTTTSSPQTGSASDTDNTDPPATTTTTTTSSPQTGSASDTDNTDPPATKTTTTTSSPQTGSASDTDNTDPSATTTTTTTTTSIAQTGSTSDISNTDPSTTATTATATTSVTTTVGFSSETQSSATSTASTSQSSTIPTTPPPNSPSEPSFAGFTYFNFSILYNATWSDALNNPTSKVYEDLANGTVTSLNAVYSSALAPGYSAIIVDKFTDSSNYTSTSFDKRFKMNTFGDDAVIAYYRAEFTTDAAFTQTAAIQDALVEIQKDLAVATIAGCDTSDEYLNDVMVKDINTNIAEVNKSKSNYCNSSADVCQPYETCYYNASYKTESGIACVPGCYQYCPTEQVCAYEAGLAAVCSCEDNYAIMGDSCVSVGLIIGLAVGIGVIIIAVLVVILVMQSRKMKHDKSMPATKKDHFRDHQWDEFYDVFSKKPTAQSVNLAFDEESALYAADDSSPVLAKSSTLASSANFSPMQVAAGTVAVEKLEATSRPPSAAQLPELTTVPSSKPADQPSKESLMAALIRSDEFKNYRPSFAGVDPNKKYVLRRTYVDNGIN